MLNYAEMVAEVAAEVRKGADLQTVVAEVAADYEADAAVLTARVARAYPQGITPAAPSAAEMEARRAAAQAAERAQAEREARAVIEGLADMSVTRPDLFRGLINALTEAPRA